MHLIHAKGDLMVLLGIVMLFNAAVLWAALHLGLTLYHPVSLEQNYNLMGIALGTVVTVALFFASRAGEWLLCVLSGARKPTGSEAQKLLPVMQTVQKAFQRVKGASEWPLLLYVSDDNALNACALGKQTVIVSRSLLEMASAEELAGVIAHELGHLYYKDSRRLSMVYGASLVVGLVFAAFSVMHAILRVLERTFGSVGSLLGLIALIVNLFSLAFRVVARAGCGILNLALLLVGRRQEYRADAFAHTLGFGAGLVSFLVQIKQDEKNSYCGLWLRLYSTHPPVMRRIGKIEGLLDTRMGGAS